MFPMAEPDVTWLKMAGRRGGNARLAMRVRDGKGTPLLWLGGFRSDMDSTKAQAIDTWAERQGRPFVRFDYSAHGRTGGAFEDMTLSTWLEDSLAMLARFEAPPIVIGSSMGGWLTLLAVRARLAQGALPPKGLVLIAPAVDFSEELMWAAFSPEIRNAIMDQGVYHLPSGYGDPYPITRAFIEDGRRHLMFGAPIDPRCPVHILQGQKDEAVPWHHALKLVEHLPVNDTLLTLVKDGDHRLSRPEDLELLIHAIERMH
jgi:pimeloyl-ACP methyl ester carboxylesterase